MIDTEKTQTQDQQEYQAVHPLAAEAEDVFTMAELLSIAGLDLTHSVISTGFETAEVSVMRLNSIFGSNKSSCTLSAIIMLVQSKLLHDPRSTPSHLSTLTGLVALTKAITAFAFLKLTTTRCTTASMKMRVVWDATMIPESVTKSKSLADGIDYQLEAKKCSRTEVRGSLRPTDFLQTGNPTPPPATPTPPVSTYLPPQNPTPSPIPLGTPAPQQRLHRPRPRPLNGQQVLCLLLLRSSVPSLSPQTSALTNLVSSPPAHSSPSISLSSCPTRS
ncbi:hypothetical protein PGT21_015081 [Puccinia graminis f. sp. tritici]|nr:hypothetical protein PGT21_015081 [Puccinia graminis f. sp. tritici]